MKEAASSAISPGPSTGARADNSPAASDREAAPTRRNEAVIERASTRAANTAAVADPAATARIFTSAPMWNMTQPDNRTAASGTQTAMRARPTSWAETVGARRTYDPDPALASIRPSVASTCSACLAAVSPTP